jgi:hypothetical protein
MASGPEVHESVRAPRVAEDLGVPVGLVEDLFMRRVLTERTTTVGDAAQALCIAHPLGIEVASALREKALIEYLGAHGRDYRIQLTDLGHRTTTQRMSTGRHVSAVPVALDQYQSVIRAQRSEGPLDRQQLTTAFSDLVLEDGLLDQIGPAFASGGAIFLYGPAGTGKTSLAERLNRIFGDPVVIPRYLEADGQIISVYDPALHEALPDQPDQLDRRWVLCQRPLILVGGELDLAMLDLQYDRISGINIAPIQVLANNGILVLDDFGRQAIPPEKILNRWIVPLSRGVDYLKANTGTKLTVPFEVKLVISTNLDPNSLGDDAFLRRLRSKVFVGPVTEDAFNQILAGVADRLGIEVAAGTPAYLCEVSRRHIGELRPYLAVDFSELAVAVCNYQQAAPVLDRDMVDRITELYFVQESAHEMSRRRFEIWSVPRDGVTPAVSRGRRWSDYEIGGFHDEEFLARLDALAATQSVDGLEPVGGIPEALRPAAP